MQDIDNLTNIVVDTTKFKDLRGGLSRAEIGRKIGVTGNQIANIEAGYRKPSADGLLRLMVLYRLKPQDLAVEK